MKIKIWKLIIVVHWMENQEENDEDDIIRKNAERFLVDQTAISKEYRFTSMNLHYRTKEYIGTMFI